MRVIHLPIFNLTDEIYDLMNFNFDSAVRKLVRVSRKSYDECEAVLSALCENFEEEEEILFYLRNFIV